MKPKTTTRSVWLGTLRLIHDLTVLDRLTGEPRCSAYALLETRLGPETTRLALAVAGGRKLERVPRSMRM